jgi:putative endonuclease
MPAVYILRCSDQSYYIGSAMNLDQRLEQHAAGVVPGYTAIRLPVELVWLCEYDSVAEAIAVERKLHGWSRAKKDALIAGRFELLPGLSSSSAVRRADAVDQLRGGDPSFRAFGAPQGP